MRPQIIHDNNGLPTGIYITMEDWKIIKNEYPNIEATEEELEQWEKGIIEQRLSAIEQNPERLQPIEKLFEELKRKI